VLVEELRLLTVYNWLQNFDPDEHIIEFVECGFQVAEFNADVSENTLDPQAGEFAVVSRKP